MRILILSRRDGPSKMGGDLLQIAETTRWLEGAGHACTLSSLLPGDLTNYDCALVFNLQRAEEAARALESLRDAAVPAAFTPIHYPLKAYRASGLRGLRHLARSLLGGDGFDRVQRLGRNLLQGQGLAGSLARLKEDETSWQKRALSAASALLLCCEGEGRTLDDDPGLPASTRRFIVPLAIPEADRPPPAESSRRRGFLWVGRIEDLKAPLSAIDLASNLPEGLQLIGPSNPRQWDHRLLVEQAIAKTPSASWLGAMPREEVLEAMGRCRVHLHTSWCDTFARVNLEAIWAGAAPVISRHSHAAELFGDLLPVADPGNGAELLDAALRAWEDGPSAACRERLRRNHGWSVVGPRLEAALAEIVESR